MQCRRHALNDEFRTIPKWRLRMAICFVFGILLGIINEIDELGKMTWENEKIVEELAPPFKVPGPQTFCNETREKSVQITFIESSSNECLTPRQACGVESAARANPKMPIKIYLNTHSIGLRSWDSRILRPGKVRDCLLNRNLVTQHPNVEFVRSNFSEMLQNTPFEPLLSKMNTSSWSVVQLSDMVRLILLKKHGGFYLDFDNIVFRKIHCLRNTFSYLENYLNIENGIMVLDAEHPFINFLMRYLAQTYDPNDRVCMGPPAFGKAFLLFCQTETLKTGVYNCHGNSTLTLIDPDAFFPVRHNQNSVFYSTSLAGYDTAPMARAFLTHVYLSSWGSRVDPNSLYARLARQYCPFTWNTSQKIPLGF